MLRGIFLPRFVGLPEGKGGFLVGAWEVDGAEQWER